MIRLTKREREAIASLHRLSKRWPSSLWLFSANGTLSVMKKCQAGRAILPCGGVDPAYAVYQVNIENEGGDW